MMGDKIKILIAEDHGMVREGIKMIIESQDDMEIVGEAGDGRTTVELARKQLPDIILMDIAMPKLNGLKAAAVIKRILPDIKILILTRHTDDAYLQELLKAGVSGYALKQTVSTELIRAIRLIANGNNYIDPAMTDKLFDNYKSQRNKLRDDVSSKSLTKRELEIIRYVALGYSNQEIADKINVSIKTVELHKSKALKKLNFSSRREIISYAILQGWIHED